MPKKRRGLFAFDVDEILKTQRMLSMLKMRIGDAVDDGLLGKIGKQWCEDIDRCNTRLRNFLDSFTPPLAP